MNSFSTAFCSLAFTFTVFAETDLAIYSPGDVKIVGLFQIHEPEGGVCGSKVRISSVMTSEAVKWYLKGLNTFGQLPFKIGFEGYRTCRLMDKTAEIAVGLMNRSLAKEGIAGIIGPEFSSEAEIISPVFGSVPSQSRLAQVGFSTTAARLSDDNKFPNIIRVVPPDDVQIEVMIQSMLELKWNRIAVVFEDDTYGKEATDRLEFRAKQESICVSLTERISVNGVTVDEITALLNNIIVGSGNRPPIHGIVYIGSSSTAHSVLLTLNGAGFSSVPIVMLSEGVNMNTHVFRQFNGQLLLKAKGSLVLSPTYREITEFIVHWRSIFTNKTYFEEEVKSNPWLLDVFYDATQCGERNCKFTEMTDVEYKEAFEVQPLYIQYAVLATHALAKSVQVLHQELCSVPGSCSSFATEFQAGDVLDKLKGLTINMATDFKWKLESLSSLGLEMTVSPTGEMVLPDEKPSYQLFNFRSSDDLSDEFALIKVGDYTGRKLSIDTSKIRDYDSTGKETVWPNVRKAQCNKQTRCQECIPIQDLHESFIYEEGDIYVIAAVPVFDRLETDGCGSIRKVSGYQTLEAIRLAVVKVNTKTGDFANFFPGLKIGLVVLNSCNNPVVIQRKIYNLHKNGILLHNGTVVKLTNKILGYVGDLGSSVSIAMAEVLSRLHFAQISFASTSPFLSDRSKYPYFLRIPSPDDSQAKAIIGIIQKLNANFVQIVYSVGAYGEGGRDKIKEAAYKNKICVAQEIPVEETGSPYEVYETLRRIPTAKIVIIFLRSHRVEEIMNALVSQIAERGEFIFIGSEAWARKKDPFKNDDRQRLLGSFTLSIEMYQDNELRDHIRKMTPTTFNKNPWSLIYLQTKRNCYFDFSFDKTMAEECSPENDFKNDPNFVLDSWDTAAFVAAKCLLIGANAYLREKCGTAATTLCEDFGNTTGLVGEIRKTRLDLDGSGSKIKVFNDNGDGSIGYRIYNIQRDDTLQNLIYVEVGRYPLEGTFTFEKSMMVSPTNAEVVSTCPNQQVCSGCFEEDKQIEPESSETSINLGMIVLGVLLAIAVIIAVILFVIVMRLRKITDRGSEIYLTPTPHSDGGDMKRQEAVGSEGFGEIPPCTPPGQTIETENKHF